MFDIELDFSDLEPIEKPFSYQGVDYILVEASADNVRKFNNERTSRIEFGTNGKVSRVNNVADLVFVLLHGSVLFAKDRTAVPEAKLKSWSGRLVEKLFTTLKIISGIDEGVTRQLRSFSEILDEPTCPVNRQEFVGWIDSLNNPLYKELARILKEPTVKE